MTEEDNLELLADISNEIFHEGYDDIEGDITFDWQIQKNIQNPTTFNQEQELQDILSAIKGKLDIISQNFCNETDSPQLSYLKSLITTDLVSFSSSLDESISALNQAINHQQSLNVGDGQILSPPLLLSIPLNC